MQLFFPDISRFKDPDAHCLKLRCTSAASSSSRFSSAHVCEHVSVWPGFTCQRVASVYVMGRDNVFPERVFGYVHPNGARQR